LALVLHVSGLGLLAWAWPWHLWPC